jgi:hypothetical protein
MISTPFIYKQHPAQVEDHLVVLCLTLMATPLH